MEDEYAECCKTHSSLDGKSDGCQKFWASRYSTTECEVCDCHRNFHRKVIKYKTTVVYTKCHKVHNLKFTTSVDGCQEFTPKGQKGTEEALTCALCGCHRGFHRNEVTVEVI